MAKMSKLREDKIDEIMDILREIKKLESKIGDVRILESFQQRMSHFEIMKPNENKVKSLAEQKEAANELKISLKDEVMYFNTN